METKFAILTVNFNTPEYIFALNKSLRKYNSWYKGNLIVYDNSTEKVLPDGITDCFDVRYVDNTIYECLDKLPPSKYPAAGRYNSARHTLTIDKMLKECDTDYCLLVDSDIIFTRDFHNLFDDFVKNDYFMMGYKRTTYKKHCIAPWCCFINLKKFREYNFNFFDFNRILYVQDNLEYDTGASIYEDAITNNLKMKELPDNSFYIHFKGGSVFKENGLNWLRKNYKLWN